jgi:hypothetical protein
VKNGKDLQEKIPGLALSGNLLKILMVLNISGKKGVNFYIEKPLLDICANCNSQILAEKVIHKLWDGPFPSSGYGKNYYEIVPYCPICEEKPNHYGNPINVRTNKI